MYSEAFLNAYDGDLDSAYKMYRRAFDAPLQNSNTPMDCEIFIQNILEEEPNRYWLYFCLGLINFREKRDLQLAREHFSSFLTIVEADRYKDQVKAARNWIEEIDVRFDTSNK